MIHLTDDHEPVLPTPKSPGQESERVGNILDHPDIQHERSNIIKRVKVSVRQEIIPINSPVLNHQISKAAGTKARYR